jgi:hypothetical protein
MRSAGFVAQINGYPAEILRVVEPATTIPWAGTDRRSLL